MVSEVHGDGRKQRAAGATWGACTTTTHPLHLLPDQDVCNKYVSLGDFRMVCIRHMHGVIKRRDMLRS